MTSEESKPSRPDLVPRREFLKFASLVSGGAACSILLTSDAKSAADQNAQSFGPGDPSVATYSYV